MGSSDNRLIFVRLDIGYVKITGYVNMFCSPAAERQDQRSG
jgi:hypothetical protein